MINQTNTNHKRTSRHISKPSPETYCEGIVSNVTNMSAFFSYCDMSYFLKFLIPRLIYSFIYLCICVSLHVYILTWRFEMAWVSTSMLTALFPETGFTDWARPAGHGSQGSSVTISPGLRLQICLLHSMCCFYVSAGN